MIKVILILLLLSSNAFANTRDGLIAWWKFDDRSGTSAFDSSGNGNAGTLNNSPTWLNGIRSGALNFNVSNQYVSVSDTSVLRVEAAAFSISLWVNVSVQPSGNEMIMLFKCAADQSTGGFGFGYDNRAGTTLNLYKAGVADQRSASQTLSNSTWYHLVAVQNFSGASPSSVTYYVNGASIGSTSNASNYSGSSGQALSIGAGNNTYTGGIPFNGIIDDVRMYSRAVTAQEALDLYNEGIKINNAKFNNAKFNY